MTPQEAIRLFLGALAKCALILIAFALFVLFAPWLWPNK